LTERVWGFYQRGCDLWAYRQAFLDAARKADPTWEIGKPIPSGALDGITRESVEANLRKSGSTLTSVDMKI